MFRQMKLYLYSVLTFHEELSRQGHNKYRLVNLTNRYTVINGHRFTFLTLPLYEQVVSLGNLRINLHTLG